MNMKNEIQIFKHWMMFSCKKGFFKQNPNPKPETIHVYQNPKPVLQQNINPKFEIEKKHEN